MTFEAVPTEPNSTLWSGELSPRLDLEDDDSKDFLHRRLDPDELKGDLPIVSIGRPEVVRFVAGVTPPGFQRVGSHDFYVIRLWCSFRDFESEIEFERAHFKVALSSPDGPTGSPIAHDMYPSEVLYKFERDVKISLSPEVKFTNFAGKLGTLDYGFSYTELQPSFVAAGQGEATPSWAFSRTKGYALRGGKAVHLIVAAAAGTAHADAALDVIAYVRKPGLLSLPMGLFEERGNVPAKPLSARLW
jgi:hypothetical protein